MATKKTAKKSTKKSNKKSAAKTKSTKKPAAKQESVNLVPGNDPIIVGGGSVFLDFDRRFTAKIHSNPGKRKFQDDLVSLEEVVVLDSAGTVTHRHALNATDTVMVCYTGSTCPER